MADEKIGIITHYYDKIGVAVVKLNKGSVKTGDDLKLTAKNGEEFTQIVEQMQIEHASIEIAKTGDEFGLKVDQEPKTQSTVFKAK